VQAQNNLQVIIYKCDFCVVMKIKAIHVNLYKNIDFMTISGVTWYLAQLQWSMWLGLSTNTESSLKLANKKQYCHPSASSKHKNKTNTIARPRVLLNDWLHNLHQSHLKLNGIVFSTVILCICQLLMNYSSCFSTVRDHRLCMSCFGVNLCSLRNYTSPDSLKSFNNICAEGNIWENPFQYFF